MGAADEGVGAGDVMDAPTPAASDRMASACAGYLPASLDHVALPNLMSMFVAFSVVALAGSPMCV